MVELRDNNPFRDAAFKNTSSSTATMTSTRPAGRNPFLDQPTAAPASPPRQQHDRHLPSKLHNERSDMRGVQTSSQPRKREVAGGSSTSQARPSRPTRPEEASHASRSGMKKHAAHPSSSSSHAQPRRPRSVSETSAQDLRKERASAEQDGRRGKTDKGVPASSGSGDGKDRARRRKHLDKIDMLDVTGLSIAGGFHHDGPFDACNPSRNKNAKKAPVLAFAKDSTAMSMSAGPPVQPVYFGDHVSNAESFADYGGPGSLAGGSGSGKMRPAPALRSSSFDPTMKVDPIHGYESVGLGTSTFLEGAPASRAAMMARTNSENSAVMAEQGDGSRPRATSDNASGLGRKKSVIQRIRGAYKGRQESNGGPSRTQSPGMQTGEPASSSPPAYASLPGQQEYFDVKGSSSTAVAPLRKIQSELQEAPGYADVTEEEAVASTARGSPEYMSPLYRPASKSEGSDRAAGSGSSSGQGAFVKRVRSLRVGGKRKE